MAGRGQPGLRKGLLRIVAMLMLAAGGAAAWAWYCVTQPYQGFPAEGAFVTIPRGASGRTAARILEQNGVVQSGFAFRLYARQHTRRKLQAGEYFFDHPLSSHDVFWQIADGHVFQQAFTVREGETIFDIAHDLEAGKLMTANEFLAAAQNPSLVRDIAPHAKTLEGYLFPATYFLPRHPTANDVTAEMVKKFKEEWGRIAAAQPATDPTAPQRPLEQVVTLASLVERETPKPEERPLVAGAFANRLKWRIALQCDPTVIYALQEAGRYRGVLSYTDLHYDSPYNTYEHPGLPPGPIGNPGEASLRAALSPADTKFIYFVADTHGGHFFAATLVEHNRNVARYHRLLAGLPADPPEEEAQQETQPAPKAAPAPARAPRKALKKHQARHQPVVKKSSSRHKSKSKKKTTTQAANQ